MVKHRPVSVLAAAASLTVVATALLYSVGSTPRGGTLAEAVPESAVLRGLAAPALRPDIRSLRARTIQMRIVGGRRELRFGAMLADDGPGPLELKPRGGTGCPPGQRRASQLLHLDRNRDGRFQRTIDTAVRSRSAGCMLNHPTHQHWHFDAMAAYRLVDLTPRRRVVADRRKVSFCLRDNQPIPGTRPRQTREFFGECGRNSMQGISPGWVDLYDAATPGQSLLLPRHLRSGAYCLVLRADPRNQLRETDETDNAVARGVRIRGTRVTTPRMRSCRRMFR